MRRHRNLGTKMLAFVLGAALVWAQFADAQSMPAFQQAGAMDLAIDPRIVVTGAPARINGTLPPSKSPLTVTVTITTPSGQTVSFSGKTNAKGQFSVTFAQTATAGRYQVSAIVEGGRGSARAVFEAITLGTVVDAVRGEFRALFATARKLNQSALATVSRLPESPDRQALMKKMSELNQRLDFLAAWNAGPDGLPQALDELRNQVEAQPRALAALAPLFSGSRVWAGAAHALTKALVHLARERDVPTLPLMARYPVRAGWNSYAPGPAAAENCSDLYDLPDLLGMVSNLVALFSGLGSFVVTILANMAQTSVGGTQGFLFSQGMQAVAANAQKQAAKATSLGASYKTSLSLGVTSFLAQKLFGVFCESLSGPMTATMHAKASYKYEPWWKYEVEIRGRIVVVYPKGGSAGGIPVAGYFEGKGTIFRVWEAALCVLDNPLNFTCGGLGVHWVCATYASDLILGTLGHFCGLPASTAIGAEGISTSEFSYPWSLTNDVAKGMPAGGPTAALGFVGQLIGVTAKYFKINFNGELVGNKLSFPRLGYLNPGVDFDQDLVIAHVDYLYCEGGALLCVPRHLGFSLPYKNAAFILGRALKNGSQSVTVPGHGEFDNVVMDSPDVGLAGGASYALTFDLHR